VDVDPVPWSILLVALGTVAFVIAAETSLTRVSRSEVRKLSELGESRAKTVERLLREPAQLLTTALLLKTGAILLAGIAMVRILPDRADWAMLLMIVGAEFALFSVAQAAGRSWVLARTLGVALMVAPLMAGAMLFLWPVSLLVRRVGRQNGDEFVNNAVESALLSEDGLRRLMSAAEEESPIQETEKQMIASILEMDETVAREVMVPRIDMVALNVNTRLRDALDVILDAGHSRIPVYQDNIDRVVGFLYAKDLLKCFQANQGDVPIHTILRPAYFVPVSKKVNTILTEMQRDHVHIAMVVDEYGGIAGLLTIEDILEEIVGEIQDEYDVDEETYIQVLSPEAYLLNGRLDIYSLAKLLDADLPDEDADTLGGLIYSELGHVPGPGEAIDVAGWRFTVLSLAGRRIEGVRAELIQPAGPAQADELETEELPAVEPTQPRSSTLKYAASN
jgi:CBS domain containing-hemolysin-like protein